MQHLGAFADRRLLLADHALTLLDEADADDHRDPVRRRLIDVEHAAEELRVALVADEQRACQHVAQEEHGAEHLVGLHAARDDPLGEVARVRAQRLDASGLEGVDVVVVHRRDLREDLVAAHHPQELGIGDPRRPLLAQLRPLLAQVIDKPAQQLALDLRRLPRYTGRGAAIRLHFPFLLAGARSPSFYPRTAPELSGHLCWIRAPSRKSDVIPATVSSAPSDGRVWSPLTTIPMSDSMSHGAGRSSRISPRAWARSISPRSGEATCRSNSAASGRALSRDTTTKESPTATRARTARSNASGTATSSSLPAWSRSPACSTARRPSASNSASLFGK